MLSSKTLQQLALLFEKEDALPSSHEDISAFIAQLNEGDTSQLDTIVDTLQQYKSSPPHCTALLAFMTQYRKVVAEADMYKETLRIVGDNVKQVQQNVNAPLQKVEISSYFKILELAGHHISMYEEKDDHVHQVCEKLRAFMAKNDLQLSHFDSFFP